LFLKNGFISTFLFRFTGLGMILCQCHAARLFLFLFVLLLFLFLEIGSYYLAQADSKFLGSSDFSASAS
jgi:hypothetical protein